jgi:lysophospholipase L1-like esterase
LNIIDNSLKYLALGDSYTIGESVLPAERWSMQLVQKLRTQKFYVAEPDIIAQTGWTTAELIGAIKTAKPAHNYDFVSVLIGVNNQYRGQSLKQYRVEFVEILEIATQLAKGKSNHVFVLSIPDWGVTPFATNRNPEKIANEIDDFNEVAKNTCKSLNIKFIDITPLSRTALNDSEMIADDELHFSGKMYGLWVDEVVEMIKPLLLV